MTDYGYIRDSGRSLPAGDQFQRLCAAGCSVFFHETDHNTRPVFAKAVEALKSGDCLVVDRLDRLAWTMRELHKVAVTLAGRGIALRSVSEPWVANLGFSEPILATLSNFANFEEKASSDRRAVVAIESLARGVPIGLGARIRARARRDPLPAEGRQLAGPNRQQGDLPARRGAGGISRAGSPPSAKELRQK